MQGHYNVLFLCTGNSARSIMAEAILNHQGHAQFHSLQRRQPSCGKSASRGAQAAGDRRIFPRKACAARAGTSSPSPALRQLDFVFTVCDNAAKEVCPVWPGQPMTAHWGVPDPAAVQGTQEEVERAFREAFFTARSQDQSVS